jgi:hypothetical protein
MGTPGSFPLYDYSLDHFTEECINPYSGGSIKFINDIADHLHSTARVFADDCVIYRPIHTEKDHQLMQEDLDTLVGWPNTWQMDSLL